jgi:hypothetical protein
MTPVEFCKRHEQLEDRLAAGELTMEQFLAEAKKLREQLVKEDFVTDLAK